MNLLRWSLRTEDRTSHYLPYIALALAFCKRESALDWTLGGLFQPFEGIDRARF